ncbi:nucleic acid-binding, OB-fold-like protein [Wolffia australiana]
MDGFPGAASSAGGRFATFLPSSTSRSKKINWCSPSRKIRSSPVCLANGDGSSGKPEFDKWDQMELKFGRLLGEDPKLTLAKIMGRKLNPDASYMEIEKSFYKNKGKIDYGENMNLSTDRENLEARPRMPALARPSGSVSDNLKLNLQRPAMDKRMKSAATSEQSVVPSVPRPIKPPERIVEKEKLPEIGLRKPNPLQGDDFDLEKPSKFRIKPNLTLKMKLPSENTNDVSLLKKPELVKIFPKTEEDELPRSNSNSSSSGETTIIVDKKPDYIQSVGEPLYQSDEAASLGTVDDEKTDVAEAGNDDSSTPQVGLLGKPQRLEISSDEASDQIESVPQSDEEGKATLEDLDVNGVETVASADQEEREAHDWRITDDLLKTGERTEVELISCSNRGFVVSFGSLIGFLPYRNLGAKWKYLAFESWLRKNGLDPSLYRQKLSIMGNYESQRNLGESTDTSSDGYREGDKLTPDMKFEDLLDIYDREKIRFLSSFIGQVIRVSVVLSDPKSRKLIFSGRPKEKEEVLEKKKSLMAKISVGDVVKCCVKKITYFGIFVEIEGVPALIHQSEISWDETLDPSSFYKIGQIIDAKVHQLDFALERITLTLKEITPDPLNDALETVVGDPTSLGGAVEATQETEWADVDNLIEELKKIEGVVGVSKGRFFLSPGLTPTFQVYMASMYDNQYKLLARNGNKVQEVLVQSSMDKEQMKGAILTCTKRVA